MFIYIHASLATVVVRFDVTRAFVSLFDHGICIQVRVVGCDAATRHALQV
jgi:hypothetical protein